VHPKSRLVNSRIEFKMLSAQLVLQVMKALLQAVVLLFYSLAES